MGKGSRVVRRLLNGCRERLRLKANARGMQRGPSKAHGLRRLLVLLEREAFQELLAGPSMGAAQQAELDR